ncbi:MAG: serine/threonine protein kinase, partial [Acidobacteriia bacterium]|nr:serine/threonine protein kinase [Terriglobia bacterium]MBV8906152.1 serine/threonine protein kinase [Terriglobia bacterium]
MPKALDDDLVMSLVERALAQPPGERDTYIAETCAGDFELIGQVRNYVNWEETMNGFLVRPFCLPPEPVFEGGDLLADRFRILKPVGEGGMGVVYKAADEWLGKVVALKCATNGFDERLRSEVRHASEIAHPNVCNIFDIHTASTPDGPVEFITMEFLEGETLADRLHRAPVRRREAREIARQICAGLAEAHRHGVVHGDFKTNNIILVPDKKKGKVRAVITDFGLARGLPHDGAASSIFESAPVGGALDYMAPELFAGEKPTPASDVYALGVILFELTSGRRPSSPPARSPLVRKLIAPYRKWDRIIACCLDPVAARRFQTAAEVEEKLKAIPPPPPWVLAAAAMLALMVGVVTYRVITAPKITDTLAMLPIESSYAELAPLANKLSAETAKQLAKIHGDHDIGFRFVPLDRVRKEAVDSFGKAYTLRTSLTQDNGKIALHAVLLDARSGLPLPCVSILCTGYAGANQWTPRYSPGEERFAPAALAGMVTATLKLPPLHLAAVNRAAMTDYEAGIQETRQNSTLVDAISRLEQAVKEDPDSPLTWGA